VQNGSETGVDCGGRCPKCDAGNPCRGNGDCGSNTCVGGMCRCPTSLFTFEVVGTTAFAASRWPGKMDTQGVGGGCEVTIRQAYGNLECTCDSGGALCGHAHGSEVASWKGFSSCYGKGGADGNGCDIIVCPTGLKDGFCCAGYPTCPFPFGPEPHPRTSYTVQCDQ
jgi:hypothetical protein